MNTRPWAVRHRAARAARGQDISGLPKEGSREARLEAMIARTYANERHHRIRLLRNVGASGVVLAMEGPWWLHAINVGAALLEHGYPIGLQRYNRLRTTRVLAKVRAIHPTSAEDEQLAETETTDTPQ